MSTPKHTHLKREFYWALAVIGICTAFVLRYLWRTGSFLSLPLYAAGEAAMPFQSRVLMAWVLRFTAASPYLSGPLMRIAMHLPQPFQNTYTLMLLAVDLPAMICGVWVTRLTLEALTHDRTFSAWASFLFCYMAYFDLVIGYGIFMMPYDILSLLFFAVGVWAVVINRTFLLVLLSIPATLNRETSIFISIFFGLYTFFRRDQILRRSQYIYFASFVLQIAVWIMVRLWVRSLFPLSSYTFVWQLPKNFISLIKPPNWPLFFSLFGFTIPLVLSRYRLICDKALAKSTAILAVIWFFGMMCVGVVVEIRIFSEFAVFMAPCVALILRTSIANGDLLDSTVVATKPVRVL